jgi:hypothetical protein
VNHLKLETNHLKLETHDHPDPYTIGWIKKWANISINKQCNISLSLGKYYRSKVLCDVVDMDASHVLLGRPWQFDVDTTHKGKENSYSFTWNKRKITILPNQSDRHSSKEKGKSDCKRRLKSFQIGDKVMVYLRKGLPLDIKGKHRHRKYGPFSIIRNINDIDYVIDLPSEMGIINTFNVADLALYHPEQALYEDNSRSSSKQPGENDEGQ